jgi:hypothetical protein
MDRPPRRRTERLVDGRLLLRSLLWLGTLQTLLCFAGFFWLYWSFGYRDLLHLPRPDLLPYDERRGSPDGRVYLMATSMFHAGVVDGADRQRSRLPPSAIRSARGLLGNRLLLAGFARAGDPDPLMIRAGARARVRGGPLPLRSGACPDPLSAGMLLAEEGAQGRTCAGGSRGRPAAAAA